MTLKLVSWNLHCLAAAWEELLANGPGYQVGLVQEMGEPEGPGRGRVIPEGAKWETAGWERRSFRTAVVCLDDALVVDPVPMGALGLAGQDDLAVSRLGTIAAGRVQHEDETITVVSVYSAWERPIPTRMEGGSTRTRRRTGSSPTSPP